MKIFITLMLSMAFLFSSVDINNATVKEFKSLKGVGEIKALAIVEYRKKAKCFKSIKDLSKVKGIGDSIIMKNKSSLTLGKCK